ncbi:unnamed protein product [Rhizoctonia solani]|uniref:Uncharacterized protein n=1 Tax=Rhizoctonia solani TaxID=456999 RepID=A0A8H3C546_9AGAM|nr:unnamed protein product [Rhizoctonia solani]
MSTQVYYPQVTFAQPVFTHDALDFTFMDSQPLPLDVLPNPGLPNTWDYSDISNIELDQELVNMCSNMTAEEIQQMIDTFPVSLAELPQEAQSVPFETSSFQLEVPTQTYEPTTNVLPQPRMIVPSQAPIASRSAAPAPKHPRPTPVASGSQTPHKTVLLKAITLLQLNLRFNPLFQKMGIVSCPDKIDLKAGMEREDAVIAAGYLPQTHVPWEQALKLLGKQGFRTYYCSEMKRARASSIELPPVPEWITRYCFAKGAGRKPTSVSKSSSAAISLKNKQMVAKVLLARNNPTRRSKAAARKNKNKGKGKAVDIQCYNPYGRQ